MAKIRLERINAELARVLSDIINNRMKDPKVTGMISVTRVEVTQDLSYAKVWLSIFADDAKEVFAAIERSAGYIRREAAAELKDMRTMPEFRFVYDNSAEYSQRISDIIDSLNKDKK